MKTSDTVTPRPPAGAPPIAGQPIIQPTQQSQPQPPVGPERQINLKEDLKLVKRLAWRFWRSARDLYRNRKPSVAPEIEDFLSAGKLGLVEAAKRYNPRHHSGAKFTTFAYAWIYKRLKLCLDDYRKGSVFLPLLPEVTPSESDVTPQEPNGVSQESIDEGGAISDYFDEFYPDYSTVPDDQEKLSHREKGLQLALGAAFKKRLSPLQRRVIQLRYPLNGQRRLTQLEVSKELKLSRRQIIRIEEEALWKLRKDPVLELFKPEVEHSRKPARKVYTMAPDESEAFPGVTSWMAKHSPARKNDSS
jgi:RNA polymerase sigma factor (sigma-70 family)